MSTRLSARSTKPSDPSGVCSVMAAHRHGSNSPCGPVVSVVRVQLLVHSQGHRTPLAPESVLHPHAGSATSSGEPYDVPEGRLRVFPLPPQGPFADPRPLTLHRPPRLVELSPGTNRMGSLRRQPSKDDYQGSIPLPGTRQLYWHGDRNRAAHTPLLG